MQELRISEKNEKEFAENAQRVVKSVEAGDLALYDIIE